MYNAVTSDTPYINNPQNLDDVKTKNTRRYCLHHRHCFPTSCVVPSFVHGMLIDIFCENTSYVKKWRLLVLIPCAYFSFTQSCLYFHGFKNKITPVPFNTIEANGKVQSYLFNANPLKH